MKSEIPNGVSAIQIGDGISTRRIEYTYNKQDAAVAYAQIAPLIAAADLHFAYGNIESAKKMVAKASDLVQMFSTTAMVCTVEPPKGEVSE